MLNESDIIEITGDKRTARKRFEGKEKDVIEYVKTVGQNQACFDLGITVLTLRNWLRDEGYSEDWGITGIVSPNSAPLAEQIVEAMLATISRLETKVSKLEAQIQEERRTINYLERELGKHSHKSNIQTYILPLLIS